MKPLLLAGALVVPAAALGTYIAVRSPARAEQTARSAATAPREAPQPPPSSDGLRLGTFEPAREAPGFTLDGSNGQKLSLSDYRGKVVILEFGFTFCEHVCPITLARLTEAFQKLGSAASSYQFVFITVDPARDNPERLREHLTAFNPSFLGVTGPPSELDAVMKNYGVFAEQVVSRNKALGYEVNHSSFLYLVDADGKLRGLVPFGTSADDIVRDLKLVSNPEK